MQVFYYQVCVFSVICCGWITSEHLEKGRVTIAGLFPLSHAVPEGHIGRGVRPAVNMARDLINNDDDILPHHRLDIVDSDTKVI